MNDPIKVLFDEHDIITNVIDAAKGTSALIGTDDDRYEKIIRQLLDFFRNYADKFHHHKEEEILFPEMCKRNELLQSGVIQEMLENHAEFRDMLASIEKFLSEKNYRRVDQQLMIYCEALLDHIAVENDEVFQMAESLFGENELENIYFRFNDCDKEMGESKKDELVRMAGEIYSGLNKA